MIQYNCPQCGEALESPSSLAGKQDTCPLCGYACTIPQAPSRKPIILATAGAAVAVLTVALLLLLWPYEDEPSDPSRDQRPGKLLTHAPAENDAPKALIKRKLSAPSRPLRKLSVAANKLSQRKHTASGQPAKTASKQSSAIPGLPLKNMTAKLECPIGVLVNVEFPKQVLRKYAYSTELKMVNGELTGENKWRDETYSLSGGEKPIWLVFDASDTIGSAVSINEEEYTIKIAGSKIKCLGGDIAEDDSAMAIYNMILLHKGKRGYRRLLFVIPSEARTITVQYAPKNGVSASASAELPAG